MGTINGANTVLHQVQPLTNERLRPSLGQLFTKKFGLVGNRGAMAGIGLSIGIAMAYWGIGQLFEQIGNAHQLPPGVAAWSPDVLFALAGTYLLLRMRS
jgi:Lipopolysaccharide export system permease LptF/LptG